MPNYRLVPELCTAGNIKFVYDETMAIIEFEVHENIMIFEKNY